MKAKFHTFTFTPDIGRSDILRTLMEKIAGNYLIIEAEDHYEDYYVTGLDVKLGCWATDEEWDSIINSWKFYCDESGLPVGYLE